MTLEALPETHFTQHDPIATQPEFAAIEPEIELSYEQNVIAVLSKRLQEITNTPDVQISDAAFAAAVIRKQARQKAHDHLARTTRGIALPRKYEPHVTKPCPIIGR